MTLGRASKRLLRGLLAMLWLKPVTAMNCTAPKMEMRLSDAVWLAEKGVTMQGPSGTLRAAQLEADDKAAIYRFRKIQMRLIGVGGK